jgi:hypothetical protein
MSQFRKYDHVERFGHDDVQGLDIGEVYVFPKLDGTNASVWFECGGDCDGPHVCCGSRNRTLSAGEDNAGFHAWTREHQRNFWDIMDRGPDNHNWVLYGEWLVPHTLRTYRGDAWRRFWVFDVWDRTKKRYVHYTEYSDVVKATGLDVIEPLCIINNPSEEQLRGQVLANSYLIQDGSGAGEGIVCKNYSWQNRYGRQPWMKIVRNEFKEESQRAFGTTEKDGPFQVEAAIAEEFVTPTLVQKELAKIINEIIHSEDFQVHSDLYFNSEVVNSLRLRALESCRPKIIPRLLQTVFHCVVQEELWTALKKHKDPTINFKRLRQHCILRTKAGAPDLF